MSIINLLLSITWVAMLAAAYIIAVQLLKKIELY